MAIDRGGFIPALQILDYAGLDMKTPAEEKRNGNSCENDTFCDEGYRFHQRLLEQGVPVYGKRFLHSSHGFVVQRKDEYQEAERMILAALGIMKKK